MQHLRAVFWRDALHKQALLAIMKLICEFVKLMNNVAGFDTHPPIE